jgi:hypothetical protein
VPHPEATPPTQDAATATAQATAWPTSAEPSDEDLAALPEHPVGTLAIVLTYAALFVVGWLALWLGLFSSRGLPSG